MRAPPPDAATQLWPERFPPREYGARNGGRGASPDSPRAHSKNGADSLFGDRVAFPDKLVFALLVMFGFPVINCILLALDQTIIYWVGRSYMLAILVPFALAWGYLSLVLCGPRRKGTVICMSILPAAALLILGQAAMYQARGVASELLAEDCGSHFPAKWDLERAHQAASALLTSCVQNQTRSLQVPMQQAVETTRVQRCPGYDQLLERHKRELPYLELLERRKQCAGWCTNSRPLWTDLGPVQVWDGCATTVGVIMERVVVRSANQVTCFCVVLMLIFAVALIGGGPQMKANQAADGWP